MPVLALKTELKCKLCRHDRREEIDAILEKRSLGAADESGRRYNLDYVLELLRGLGVENPTKENITGHWKRHCEVVTEQEAQKRQVDEAVEAAQTDERVRALVASIAGEDYFEKPRLLTADESLELIRALGVFELAERVRKGEKIGITPDHLLKSIDGATRRRSSEAAGELMSGLGKALGQWATQKALPEAPPERKELGVVEHEPEEVVVE